MNKTNVKRMNKATVSIPKVPFVSFYFENVH